MRRCEETGVLNMRCEALWVMDEKGFGEHYFFKYPEQISAFKSSQQIHSRIPPEHQVSHLV